MFLLPLVVFPFVVVLAVHRLYSVPRLWLGGVLKLSRAGTHWLTVAAALAYAMVFGHTVLMGVLVAGMALRADWTLAAWLSLAPFTAAYPVVYVAMEWVFYHAFQRPPMRR